MIRDEFCDENISVFVTYFSNFQNNENRNTEVDKISYDVEIHIKAVYNVRLNYKETMRCLLLQTIQIGYS